MSDSSCAYSDVTRDARSVSYASYSTCSVGAVNAAGNGNCGEVESMPLMLIEVEADSKVWFMYYFRVRVWRYVDIYMYILFGVLPRR